MFDALITGGIPMLPRSLTGLARLGDLRDDEVVFYDAIDIVEPQQVVAKANRLYESQGTAGKLNRIQRALKMHHLDARIRRITTIGTAYVRDTL